MICPSCKGEVKDGDWLCPFCEHILDPSVLGVDVGAEEAPVRAERTKIIAWDPGPESDPLPDPPDAMILGEVGVEEKEFSVVPGAAAGQDGRTSTFLFYTSGATSRILHPDAIVRRTERDATIPRTPYEDFLLALVDGVRSVRAIQKASGLAPQEVVITMLTLLDKGVIGVDSPGGFSAPRRSPLPKSSPGVEDEALLEDATVDGYPSPAKSQSPVPTEDLEDLPSVRDFHEIDSTEAIYEEEGPTTELSGSDLPADLKPVHVETRWGSDTPAQDAEDLVESEEDLPVVPSDLDASDSEMITDHGDIERVREVSRARAQSRDPKTPGRTPLPPLVPITPSSPTPRPPAPRGSTPPPPELDLAFLVEVPRSTAARAPSMEDKTPPPASIVRAAPPLVIPDDEDSRPKVQPLSPAPPKEEIKAKLPSLKRTPIEERSRKKEEPPPPAKKPTSGQTKADRPERAPDRSEKAERAESRDAKKMPTGAEAARMIKAQKLYDEALKDRAEGNFLSARMNMKLALTFDPSNEIYQAAFDELQRMGAISNASAASTKGRARELYDLATQKEEIGDVDEAIALLEKALHESKEPAFYNRLGVILATKKREFSRAQQLIETAIQISPGNSTYQHNLGKVLSMAAAQDVASRNTPQGPGGKKSGLLGFLGRKK